MSDDYDSLWKEGIEQYFEEFTAFFFPKAYKQTDWTGGYEFLDKELHQISRYSDTGSRIADRLMQVWKKNGDETWVMAHAEIQGGKEDGFPRSVYVYNYRGQEKPQSLQRMF